MSQTENRLNVHRLMAELSAILSERHGAKITLTAVPKEKVEDHDGVSEEKDDALAG